MLAWKYLIFHCYFFKCWESETAVPLPFQVTVAAHYVSVVCFQITGVETNKHKQFYVYHGNKLKWCFFCQQAEALASYLEQPLKQIATSWHVFLVNSCNNLILILLHIW